ncbi:MAG: hypothetical protein OXS33_03325 [bacterium]|nr:hypothetical protein [bacterium]
MRGLRGGVQVVFPGGEFAIYRAESVNWDRTWRVKTGYGGRL